jgi:hypothetical protein
MFDIHTSGDIAKGLNLEKQIRFAAASTLTKVAGRSQDAVNTALQGEFVIRKPWWKHTSRHGIKIKKATKTDLVSAVYTSADWLIEAEGFAAGENRKSSIPLGPCSGDPRIQS